MSIFNPGPIPQGKDEMPNWTNVTRPISDVNIPADKSSGMNFANIGGALGDLAGIVDTTMKDVVSKDVRNTVEPIREDYTNQLLATKAMIAGNEGYVPPAGKDQSLDLLASGSKMSVPAGIDAGLKKVDRIANLLKFGSGKLGVDETYYDMRLKTAVTDLRSRYPGYVDLIDSKVAAITGVNPANEVIRDVTRQITQLQSTRKSEYDKELEMARKSMGELQGGRVMYETLLQRGPEFLPQWRVWYETESRKWQELKERDVLRKDRDAGTKDFEEVRTKDWTNEVSSAVSSSMNTTVTVMGADAKTIGQMLDDFQANPGKYNADQMRQFATMIKAQGASIARQLMARAAETFKDKNGKTYSYNSDIGAAKVQEIQKNILQYYDNMHDALMNDKAGVAMYWANRAKAMGEQTKFEVYSGPEGETLRLWNVIKSDMGDQAVPNLMTGLVKTDMDKTVNKLFEKSVLKAKTQADPKTGSPSPTPFTMKGMNDEALTLEQQGQISKSIRSRYSAGGMELMLKDITDPSAPDNSKVNSLKFFFSPEGQGLLNQYNNDRTNPATGKYEPGKQTVWNKLTSEAIVNEVKKLSNKDATVGQMYKSWIIKEAGAGLFYKDLQNLQTFTGMDDLYFKYNNGKPNGTPHIELLSDKGALQSPVGQKAKVPDYSGLNTDYSGVNTGKYPYEGRIKYIQQSVNRINEALRGLDRMVKGLGGDSSSELLAFMIQAQAVDGRKWEGLPASLMDAIAASQGKGKLQDLYQQQQKGKQ